MPDASLPDARRTRRLLGDIMTSPVLFLRELDPDRDLAFLVEMSEADYRASIFMDNRLVHRGGAVVAVGLESLTRLCRRGGEQRHPAHYIFHTGHCGSTLVSRLLGELPVFHALREPPVMMGLSRALRCLDDAASVITPARFDAWLELFSRLAARTWRASQAAIVKPTSHTNNLIPALMRQTGDERGVAMHLDLDSHLAIMLRPHTRRETRLYSRDFRQMDFRRSSPDPATWPAADEAGPLAAMGWLLHARELATALDDPAHAGRLTSLHFDDYLADDVTELGRMCRFFGHDVPAREIEKVVAGPVGRGYSKSREGSTFGRHDRAEILSASRRDHAPEIAAGLAWAERIAASVAPFNGLIERFPGPRALA